MHCPDCRHWLAVSVVSVVVVVVVVVVVSAVVVVSVVSVVVSVDIVVAATSWLRLLLFLLVFCFSEARIL